MAHRKEFKSDEFSDQQLVTASTETVGTQQSQESLWAQAELQRRLMVSICQLDESTNRYSRALLVLGHVMFFIAILQLMFTIINPLPEIPFFTKPDSQIIVFLGMFAAIMYVIWKVDSANLR